MCSQNIIQWNCRGLRNNFNDLQILVQDLKPSALCLQETFLKATDTFDLGQYRSYDCFSPPGHKIFNYCEE